MSAGLDFNLSARAPLAASVCVADILLHAARLHPTSGVHLESTGPEGPFDLVTYPMLLNQARRILGGLQALPVRAGRHVVLLLERPADFIPAFWACVLGGYVPCPLAPVRNDPERWAKHVAHVDELLDHLATTLFSC